MLYNSVSTVGMSRRLMSSLGEMQLEQLRTNDEIASGKHYDMAQALGARTGYAIGLRNMYDEADQFVKGGALLKGRMDTMDSALNNILDAGKDVLAAASTGLGQPGPTGSSLQVRARGVLEQIVGLLNASSGNGYLFGGVAVTSPPMRAVQGDGSALPSPIQIVGDTITAATGGSSVPTTAAQTAAVVSALNDLFDVRDPALPPPAPLTQSYEGGFYVGATTMQPGGAATPRVTGRPADAVELPYGIQANDKPFRDLMQGLYMLATVDTSKMELDAYKPYIETAVSKMSGGLDNIRNATSQLGIYRHQLEETIESHKTRQKVLSEQINSLEEVPPEEASVRLNQLEVQIEAASSATARIAKMRLSNYL